MALSVQFNLPTPDLYISLALVIRTCITEMLRCTLFLVVTGLLLLPVHPSPMSLRLHHENHNSYIRLPNTTVLFLSIVMYIDILETSV